MSDINQIAGFLIATICCLAPTIMWSEVAVMWLAARGTSIPALRHAIFATACRAAAVTTVGVLVLDNLTGIDIIDTSTSRWLVALALILVVAPSVRFLYLYFTNGFQSRVPSVEPPTEGNGVRT